MKDVSAAEALELYLTDRRNIADSTRRSHRSRLGHFVRFVDGEEELDSLHSLDGTDILRFKTWRFDDDHSEMTIKTQLDTLRVFLRWCGNHELARERLHEAVESPTGGSQRSDILDSDIAEAVIDHLDTYRYASYEHTLLSVMWHTGMRMGAARGIDIGDLRLEQHPAIRLRHRPATETPLKNKDDGERMVSISDGVAEVINDYVSEHRPDVLDDYGREPLFASEQGRRSDSNIREVVYKWSQPCRLGDCPHDGVEEDSCQAKANVNHASKCPSSVAPHAIRRGSITYLLSEDVEDSVVADRCNVSPRVIDEHYDSRSEDQKMEQRRRHLPFDD